MHDSVVKERVGGRGTLTCRIIVCMMTLTQINYMPLLWPYGYDIIKILMS